MKWKLKLVHSNVVDVGVNITITIKTNSDEQPRASDTQRLLLLLFLLELSLLRCVHSSLCATIATLMGRPVQLVLGGVEV